MAGRFRAGGRTYIETPAGHLLATRDKVADGLRLHGHDMMHWRKETHAQPPYFSARCGKCGAGVKVVAGRARTCPATRASSGSAGSSGAPESGGADHGRP